MIYRKNLRIFIGAVLLFIGILLLCVCAKFWAFQKSHDSIRVGMSLREVFDSGLADYLMRLGNKNVPGGTLMEKQPVSSDCKRHVLDIHYFGSVPPAAFWVRVYCNMNGPSDKQVIPAQSFRTKKEFLKALDEIYAPWAKSMEFSVESPPKRLFGVYDHYNFTTDETGRVSSVSEIISVP